MLHIPLRPFTAVTPKWRRLKKVIPLARDTAAIVVGGLPTTVREAPVTKEVISAIRDFYASRGECFVAFPDLSQYPGRRLLRFQLPLVRAGADSALGERGFCAQRHRAAKWMLNSAYGFWFAAPAARRRCQPGPAAGGAGAERAVRRVSKRPN